MKSLYLLSIWIFGLSLCLASCTPEVKQWPPEFGEPHYFRPGDLIPAPRGEVILTISGDSIVPNIGDTLRLDMATLSSFGYSKFSEIDPFLQRDVVYTGVLMLDFARVLGIDDSSKVFQFTSLDDSRASLTFGQVKRWPILLATRADGEYITVEEGGPVRIIFPYDEHSKLDRIKYNNSTFFNIERIRVD